MSRQRRDIEQIYANSTNLYYLTLRILVLFPADITERAEILVSLLILTVCCEMCFIPLLFSMI